MSYSNGEYVENACFSGEAMEKKIVILGGLGVSARRDRDVDRVIDRRYSVYTLPAHMMRDRILVVKKWKEKS